jgi:predicted Zn-dependent protease
MKRFSIVFALVIAACGGDAKTTPNKIEVAVPHDAAVEIKQPGFGSAAANDNKGVVVEPKAVAPEVAVAIPTSFAECMKLGKELAAKKNHVHARELFEAAAKLDRKASAPHVELARSYIDKAERALAIRHAKKAVKLAPESSQAYNTLGRAELLRHDYDGAELAFRQATELDKDNVWAWNNLGLVYLTQKNYQEAVNALVEATSKKGVEAYMWNNLGSAYEQLDQLDDARDAFDSGAKLGSVAAKESRKRLDGVDSIKIARTDATKGVKEPSFETSEPMPAIDEDLDAKHHGDPEIEVEPHHDDVEPMVEDVTIDVGEPDATEDEKAEKVEDKPVVEPTI